MSLVHVVLGLLVCCDVPLPLRPDAFPSVRSNFDKSVYVTPGVTDGYAFKYHDYVGLTGFVQNVALPGVCGKNAPSGGADILRSFSIGSSVQG